MPWYRFRVANWAYVKADSIEVAKKALSQNPTGVGANWGEGVAEIQQGNRFFITEGKLVRKPASDTLI